uniref:Uncharacterized protein n=1 Tax=Arundo donax TaxID=35708 RepID=A0A0A8YRH0_ARUDO
MMSTRASFLPAQADELLVAAIHVHHLQHHSSGRMHMAPAPALGRPAQPLNRVPQ